MESNIVDEQQKRLEEVKKNKIYGSITNHFERLNLTPSTNLMYVKYAFLNKLSMEANEKLTLFSLWDMNTTIRGYLILSNKAISKKYIKKLKSYQKKQIKFSKAIYAQKTSTNPHLASYYPYITQSQIDWLIEKFNGIKYSINYDVDFSSTDNEVYEQLLRDIYTSLLRKQQECLINGNTDKKFKEALKTAIGDLKKIIDACKVDSYKKGASLIKKI